jgi:hypothetical protein
MAMTVAQMITALQAMPQQTALVFFDGKEADGVHAETYPNLALTGNARYTGVVTIRSSK